MVESVTSAQNKALSALRQTGIDVSTHARNVSVSGDKYASKQESKSSERVTGGVGAGIMSMGVVRNVDMSLQKTKQQMTSEFGYASELSKLTTYLDVALSNINSEGNLSGVIDRLSKTIQGIVDRPEVDASRDLFVQDAIVAIKAINKISDSIQEIRSNSEQKILYQVAELNSKIDNLAKLNLEISSASSGNRPVASLLDKRDKFVTEISELANVRAQYNTSNNTVALFAGYPLLLSGQNQLTFAATGILDVSSVYPGTLNGILVENDPTKDVTASLNGGRIGALLQIRDVEMPKLQSGLDTLATQLKDVVNAAHNNGTAKIAPVTLTGTQTTAAANAFAGAGTVRVAVIDNTNGYLVEYLDIDLSTTPTVGAIQTLIAGMTNANANINANGNFVINAQNNPDFGISISAVPTGSFAGETGTNRGFSHFFGLNDLFVGASGAGAASSLSLVSGFTQASVASTTLDTTAGVGQRAISHGDNSNILSLAQQFQSEQIYTANPLLTARATNFSRYASDFLYASSAASGLIQKNLDATIDSLENVATAIASVSGISLQEEMMGILRTTQAQHMNARVITSTKDMMDVLNNMIK